MTHTQTHLIHREILEWTTYLPQTAQRIEAESQRLVVEIIHPVIEKCFDEAIHENFHLIIERLALDLGVFQKNSFEQELPWRLRERLMHEIHHQYVATRQESSDALTYNSNDEKAIQTMQTNDTPAEALTYYLRTGHLPWWWDANVDPVEFWQTLNDQSLPVFVLELFRQIPGSVPRAVHVLSDLMLGDIVQSAGFGKAVLNGWIEMKKIALSTDSDVTRCRSIYWEYCLARCCGNLSALESATKQVVHQLENCTRLAQQELEFFFSTIFGNPEYQDRLSFPPVPDRNLPDIEADDASKKRDSIHISDVSSTKPSSSPGPYTELGNNNTIAQETPSPMPESRKEQSRAKKPVDIHDTSISVNNAGIILVHPFLEELFRDRGLIENQHFISGSDQCRAVRMLDFLCNGSDDSPEYQLLLAKLLCGMSWEEGIPLEISLDDDDKRACDILLDAVIHHWTAVRNTSIEGLREGFVRRNGILDRKNDDWKLRIEQRGQDILLNRLPWNISLIRLPWMNSPLHVAWT